MMVKPTTTFPSMLPGAKGAICASLLAVILLCQPALADQKGRQPQQGKATVTLASASAVPVAPPTRPFLRVEIGGHIAYVRSVAFTPDGQTLVSVGDDKTLRFWNVQTARQTDAVRFTVGEGEQGMLRAAAVDPTGRYIAIAQKSDGKLYGAAESKSDSLLIYDRQSAQPAASGDAPRTATAVRIDTGLRLLPALAYSPDGNRIAVVGYRDSRFCQVRVFERQLVPSKSVPAHEEWKLKTAFPHKLEEDWVSEDAEEPTTILTTMDCLAFSPDGTQIATGNRNGTVRIFDLKKGEVVASRDFAPRRAVRAIAWKSDPVTGGDALAVGVEDQLYLWNLKKQIFEKQAAGNQVIALAMDDRGRIVCGLGGNQTGVPYPVMLWDRTVVERGAAPAPVGTGESTVTTVAISPDGKTIASADATGRVYLWDSKGSGERIGVTSHTLPLKKIRWRADSKAVAWTLTGTVASSDDKLLFNGGFDLTEGIYMDSDMCAANHWNKTEDGTFHSRFTNSHVPPRLYLNNAPSGREGGSRPFLEFPDGTRREIILPFGEEALAGAVSQPDLNERRYLVTLSTNRRIGLWEATAETDPNYLRRLYGFEQLPLDVAASPDGRFVAATALDGTVRIWNLRQSAEGIALDAALAGAVGGGKKPETAEAQQLPLVSIFPAPDGEWIAWNSATGYYAASPGGDALIGWQINQPGTNLADFRTAYEMRDQKYKPEIIMAALTTGDISAAARMAGNLDAAPVTETLANLPRLLLSKPADTTLDLPTNTYQTDSDSVTIPLQVVSESAGIVPDAKVQWRSDRTTPRQDTVAVDKPVVVSGLKGGLNHITLIAKTPGSGESKPVSIDIFRKTAARTKPNCYILAIGVQKFPAAAKVPNLQYTVGDARAITDLFEKQKGRFFGEVKSQLLTDQQATRDGILNALAAMRRAASDDAYQGNEDDLIVIFASTHGMSLGGDKNFYLVTSDFDRSRPVETGVSLEELAKTLEGVQASNAVLLLDQCFSGGIGYAFDSVAARRSGNEALRSIHQKRFTTLSASTAQQISYENSNWQHGAFTYALLRVLGGVVPGAVQDDSVKGGIVRMNFAIPNIQEEVRRVVTEIGGVQQPIAYAPPGISGDQIILTKVR